jgi:hypothetical protein
VLRSESAHQFLDAKAIKIAIRSVSLNTIIAIEWFESSLSFSSVSPLNERGMFSRRGENQFIH